MSDSDDLAASELLQNGTVLSIMGPNRNASSITGVSFLNNVSSTMPSRNFNRQRYAGSNYDQRSMYRIPMSTMSSCDMMQRNSQAMSSRRSVYSGLSRSRISPTPSIDTNASCISAANIANALETMDFGPNELKKITDAIKRFNYRLGNKVSKRRIYRRHLKHRIRRSGGESGEQGSDSSISSEEKSTRSSYYNENMSRSAKTDISHFRRQVNESVMSNCTENFTYGSYQSTADARNNFNNTHNSHSFRNMPASDHFNSQQRRPPAPAMTQKGSFQFYQSQRGHHSVADATANFNNTQYSVNSQISMCAGPNTHSFRNMFVLDNFNGQRRRPPAPAMQKTERVFSGFRQPSQSFHHSVASTILPESAEDDNTLEGNYLQHQHASALHMESATSTSKQKSSINIQRKRSCDSDDDIRIFNQKRVKITSPCKIKKSAEARKPKPRVTTENDYDNYQSNDFVFAKPVCPVRKVAKEKLIAKSAAPLGQIDIPSVNIRKLNPKVSVEKDVEKDSVDELSNISQNTTDLSKRPSFIKRKLYTQRLDVSEKKNISIEYSNSPQNSIYSGIQKEKHKTRKLQQATTTSCLSRDVLQDESGLLDLINKIVPLEQMNVTNQTNKTDFQNTKNKSDDNDELNWDVTSIITNQNEDNASETYTDEEVFNATVNKLTKENESKKPSPEKTKNRKVPVEKMPNLKQKQKCNVKDDVASKTVQKGNAFWDTDFESDAECQPPNRNGDLNFKENLREEIPRPLLITEFQGNSTMFNSKPTTAKSANVSTFFNNTVDGVQKRYNTILRIQSHRITKRKNLDVIREEAPKSDLYEPQSIKQKTFQASSYIELSQPEPKTQTTSQNKVCVAATKQPENNKQALATDKPSRSIESLKILQTNNNKTQPKGQSELKTDTNNKKIVQNNDSGTKNVPIQKKTAKSAKKKSDIKQGNRQIDEKTRKETNQIETPAENEQSKKQLNSKKKNDKKTDNTQLEEQTKTETIDKNTVQSKQTCYYQNEELVENGQQSKKQSNIKNKKVKKTDNTQLEEQTKTQTIDKNTVQSKQTCYNQNEELVENGQQSKKQSNSKNKKVKKTDNTQLEEQTKTETIDKNTVQSKQTCYNQNEELVENGQQSKKQSNSKNKKVKKTDNTQLEEQTKTETIVKNTVQSKKTCYNQNEELVENGQQSKKHSNSKNKKVKKTDNTQLEEQTKTETIDKNTVQSKKTCYNKTNDLVGNKQQSKKQSNSKNKGKVAQHDTETKIQTTKKSAENKSQNKELCPKTKNTKSNNCSVTEENNNSHRAFRSCRIAKRNETLEKSNLNNTRTLRSKQIDISSTSKRNPDQSNLNNSTTLRSRQINVSSSSKRNITKANQKANNTKDSRNMSKLSDISFTIPVEFNTVTKLTRSRRLNLSVLEKSDLSFSITPRRTCRVNLKAGKEILDFKNNSKPRNRLPPKRYLT